MPGSAFGFATPLSYPTTQPIPFGLSLYGPFAANTPFASPQQYGQSLQQILQILHIVPQQLHNLQQLQYAQQQQLQHVQQLLQVLPAQLAQLQQLIQFVPQQIQQTQQLPPLQQSVGQSSAAPGGYASTSPWGIAPGVFGQPGHVM